MPKSIQRNLMPTHLFGELAKTVTGLNLLQQANVLTTLMNTLKTEENSLIQKKGTLWSIGSNKREESNRKGLEYLLETDIIKTMISIAEECEVLSLREQHYIHLD
jgi:hypothetical protein